LQRIADSPLSSYQVDRRQRFVRSIGGPFRSGNSSTLSSGVAADRSWLHGFLPCLRADRCSCRLAQL